MNKDDRLCSCGATLDPDNPTGLCRECRWWRRNGRPDGEGVDFRRGLANAIALLPATVVEGQPVIVFSRPDTQTWNRGPRPQARFRVEFDYGPNAVALLKATVPGTMRRWAPDTKCWEVSADWVGPLACAFRNAGHEVAGLDDVIITDWFGWACRLTRQHRVTRALIAAGLMPYPSARPAQKGAYTTRMPVAVDPYDDAQRVTPDYTAAVDAVISAHRDSSAAKPPCPICGRRPAKGAVVHAGCRTRLLHACGGRPFTRARSKAYQVDLCTVCTARPIAPGLVTCDHCAGLVERCVAPQPSTVGLR